MTTMITDKQLKRASSCLKISAFILVVFIISPLSAAGKSLKVGDGEIFVKRGFHSSWTAKIPDDNSWKKITPPHKLRSLRIIDLGIDEVPVRSMFSLKSYPAEDFTFIFPFKIDDKPPDFPGIYIEDIGIEWEIFINGIPVMVNKKNPSDESVSRDNSLRSVIAYIKPGMLKKGINIAAFRVTGDPTEPITGFYRNNIIFGEYDKLLPKRSETITLILIFIYLIFGLYHLFLFLNNTNERYYLYFGFASIVYFVYILSRTRTIYYVISDPVIITKAEFTALYLTLPLFGSFLDLVILNRVTRLTRIYSIFCIIFILLTLFPPMSFSFDILRIWQATAMIPIIYYAVYVLGYSFFKKVKLGLDKFPESSLSVSITKSTTTALWRTVEGNLLIGFIVVTGCMVFDILDAVYFKYGLSISKYGFFMFITGIGLILSNRFLFMLKKIESLNVDLQGKIDDLNDANRLITLSEEKYRLLVEGSNDMIFSLDENMNLKTANGAMKKRFNLGDNSVENRSFYDLVQGEYDEKVISMQILKEKVDVLISEKKPVQFKMDFRSYLKTETQEMQVKLECINVEGKNEILGKASSIMEDTLLNYFVSEKQNYSIGNYLIIADEISHRITKNLNKYIDVKSVNLVRMAIREILINAIEHGNLDINFEEKTDAVDDGSFFELVYLRQQDPSYKDRRVSIQYIIDDKSARYKVSDEGQGFDHGSILNNLNRANEEMLAHGRGIVMAKNVFDSMKFNKKGNQVLLVKNFNNDNTP